jgi:hypothetical protein
MLHSAKFFRIEGTRNKILSAFTEAVKVTVFQKIGHRSSCLPHGSKIKFWVWFYLTKKIYSARSQFFSSNLIEFLREFESICKTVLAHESGDPGVRFNEKNRGSNISWHCPFKPNSVFFNGRLWILTYVVWNLPITDTTPIVTSKRFRWAHYEDQMPNNKSRSNQIRVSSLTQLHL